MIRDIKGRNKRNLENDQVALCQCPETVIHEIVLDFSNARSHSNLEISIVATCQLIRYNE